MATDAPAALRSAPAPYWDAEADQDLVCMAVRQETHDVKTFTLRAMEGRCFGFEPGQYLRFEVDIGSETLSRCYSISSSALRPHSVSITVKRVAGGTVSNWLHDHLVPGSRLRAAGPAGVFTLPEPHADALLLVSGGSGITPVMAMLRALDDAQRHPDIVFLHAARTPADLVFRDELLYRAKVTPGLRLQFLPEQVQGEPGYTGISGRVSQALLAIAVPDIAQRTVMCCGPAPFMAAVRESALALGVAPDRYREESFTGPAAPTPATGDAATISSEATGANTASASAAPQAAPPAAPSFKVAFAKQDRSIDVGADQFVLAMARKAGIKIPSSCASGLCGTCKSKLVSGRVDMQHAGGIRQREVDAGFFLPCCAKPLTDLVIDR